MASTINTNVASLTAQRNLLSMGNSLNTAIQRLSSGLRINSAKDDAAGLAISQRFTEQVRGLNQAHRNANDAISVAQTAEGAMNQVNDMLQRGRELAVQSANGIYTDADRKNMQDEWGQLSDEIERIANTTAFNGQKLLDGSFSGALYQVGPNSGDMIAMGELANMQAAHLGQSDSAPRGLRSIDLGSAQGSRDALAVFDKAMDQVNAQRGALGAVQNRFESTINNLQTTAESMAASRSRIQDADFAQETANMTRGQMLQQAGTSLLAQANQLPQQVLSLLQ